MYPRRHCAGAAFGGAKIRNFEIWPLLTVSLKEIMRTQGEQFCVDAMQKGMKKCEEWNVEINCRTSKRKKMPEEMEADAALTSQEETKGVMKFAVDTTVAGLDTRFQQLVYLHQTFGCLLNTERLMTGDAIDLDDLHRKCTHFAAAFPDDIDSARLVDEIQDWNSCQQTCRS